MSSITAAPFLSPCPTLRLFLTTFVFIFDLKKKQKKKPCFLEPEMLPPVQRAKKLWILGNQWGKKRWGGDKYKNTTGTALRFVMVSYLCIFLSH